MSQHQSEFERLFLSELERHRELVSDALQNIIETRIPPELEILLLESHSHWYAFPVYVFSLDREGQNETYFKKPFSGALVSKKRKLVHDRAIDQDHFEDHDVDTFKTGHEIIAKWIGDIWLEVGGESFDAPAYVAAHDDPRFFDLKRRRWVRRMKSRS